MTKFLKEHKNNLRKLTKKQLIQQVLNHIEIDAHIQNQFDMAYEKLDEEKQICESELIKTEKELEEKNKLLDWYFNKCCDYDNMSVFKFIKSKYAK